MKKLKRKIYYYYLLFYYLLFIIYLKFIMIIIIIYYYYYYYYYKDKISLPYTKLQVQDTIVSLQLNQKIYKQNDWRNKCVFKRF